MAENCLAKIKSSKENTAKTIRLKIRSVEATLCPSLSLP